MKFEMENFEIKEVLEKRLKLITSVLQDVNFGSFYKEKEACIYSNHYVSRIVNDDEVLKNFIRIKHVSSDAFFIRFEHIHLLVSKLIEDGDKIKNHLLDIQIDIETYGRRFITWKS